MRRHNPRRELVSDNAAAKPPLETDQEERGDGRPENARLAAVVAPCRDCRRENQETDGDAEEPVQKPANL